jgi:hypothetical protein
MVELARFVERVFLPSLVLGVALGLTWRYLPVGGVRTALQWVASLLFFVPQPFALFLGAYSFRLRLYQQVLLALWGFGVCVLVLLRFRQRGAPPAAGVLGRMTSWCQTPEEVRNTHAVLSALRTRPPKPRNRAVQALAALALAALGIWCGWNVVGDYLLTPRLLAGTVEGARIVHGTRSPSTYRVIVDHQAYNITRDLLDQLRPGDVIEADVGVASGTIRAIRSTARASR